MADFKIALAKTMGNEGLYDNDTADVGGETFMGISRRYHPSWAGWSLIDLMKNKQGFPGNLATDKYLVKSAEDHYKSEYWDRFLGDHIIDQNIANELFDTGVNLGVHRAVKFLQDALNYLNRNGQSYADISDDGVMGDKTLVTLGLLSQKDLSHVLKVINILQGMHYLTYMSKDPKQERFARGWLERVEFTKV